MKTMGPNSTSSTKQALSHIPNTFRTSPPVFFLGGGSTESRLGTHSYKMSSTLQGSSYSDISGGCTSTGDSHVSIQDADFEGLLDNFLAENLAEKRADAVAVPVQTSSSAEHEIKTHSSKAVGDLVGKNEGGGLISLVEDDQELLRVLDDLSEESRASSSSGGGTNSDNSAVKNGVSSFNTSNENGTEAESSSRHRSRDDPLNPSLNPSLNPKENLCVEIEISDERNVDGRSRKRATEDGIDLGSPSKKSKTTAVESGIKSEIKSENGGGSMCPPHPGYVYGLCVRCGAQKEEGGDSQEAGVPLSYQYSGLELSRAEANRLAASQLAALHSKRKLNLVLDLDLTLLNTCPVSEVSEQHIGRCESWMKREGNAGGPRTLYFLPKSGFFTKLRPFVFEFLDELRELYELHIYTMGERPYALQMSKLLDPTGGIFQNRVISRNDSAKESVKNLDVVLGANKATLIVDDTENVWPEHKDNLLRIERYLFFEFTARQYGVGTNLLGKEADENPRGGQLEILLGVLKRVHKQYFDDDYHGEGSDDRDARGVLKEVRTSVLRGVKLVFSSVIPKNHPAPQTHKYWRLAEELGAKVVENLAKDVTHVVATVPGTEKVFKGCAQGCRIVTPRWLDHCSVLWAKAPETSHLLNLGKK